MQTKETYGGLDRFRPLAAALVVAIHTSPLTTVHADADFFLTRILARIAVPFFFMVTGQFVLADILSGGRRQILGKLLPYLKKTGMLYGISILLYLPLGLYAGHYENPSLPGLLRMLLFDGTFYHLWYFPACILGICLLCLLGSFLGVQGMTITAGVLYLLGLLGDSYFGFIQDTPVLGAFYTHIFRISSYTRNGIFFAPLFLLLGARMNLQEKKQRMPRFVRLPYVKPNSRETSPALLAPLLLLSFLLLTAEGFLLHGLEVQRHDSMYLMLPLTALLLYRLLLCWKVPSSRAAREIATGVYILHPAMIIVVRLIAKILHCTALLVDNSLVHYFLVLALSFAAAALLFLLRTYGKTKSCSRDRAWIELDRKALAANVRFLQSMLPEHCTLMPVVKANAYGHGAVPIAKALHSLGIRSFCVACVSEAVELRRAGIQGEILILGYTHPSQFPLLHRYHLSQTIVDHEYALLLNQYGKKTAVHVGIDTGMHRLGERVENVDLICQIFAMPHLEVKGLFTHLSADDTLSPQGRAFTEQQAEAFYRLASILEARGCLIPKLHIQSSYGVLNYPALAGDCARIGIALYGVLSTKEDTARWADDLSPVLSLKARVASVRELHPGESAGYGMDFIAEQEMRIAAVSIGYGDGLPRGLSGGAGNVLIKGEAAPIIGRVCMDQTLVDVSRIPQVRAGDIAVLIGVSGSRSILASDLAAQTNTITNEILSRLGSRLERI